jgi:hypothetical protein
VWYYSDVESTQIRIPLRPEATNRRSWIRAKRPLCWEFLSELVRKARKPNRLLPASLPRRLAEHVEAHSKIGRIDSQDGKICSSVAAATGASAAVCIPPLRDAWTDCWRREHRLVEDHCDSNPGACSNDEHLTN